MSGCGVTGALAAALAFAAGVGFAEAARPLCPEAAGWRPVAELSDEFDGVKLDAAKWDDWCYSFQGRRAQERPGTPCKTGFMFSPDNVRVEKGELVLTARMQDARDQTHRNEYLRYAPYSVALVKSKAKRTYGYYEMRARTMRACVSNAFWLYDPHSDNPKVKYREGDVSEEIDIFEVTGKPDFAGTSDCTRTYYNTVHFYCTPYLEGWVSAKKERRLPASFKTKTDFDFGVDYHVHGLLWTPEKLVWYLDGKPVAERKNGEKDFQRPLHVTVDAEVFPTWFGHPDPKDLPAEFRIDYIRVWGAFNDTRGECDEQKGIH